MGPIARSIVGVIVGLLVGGIAIGGIEALGHLVYRLPEGVDPSDPDALRAVMDDIPAGAFLVILLAWAIGTSSGAWVAARLAGRSWMLHALIVGALFLVAGLFNLLMLPHPIWFWVAGLALFLPAAYLGGRLARPGV